MSELRHDSRVPLAPPWRRDLVLFSAEPSSIKKLMRTEESSAFWSFLWLNLVLGRIWGVWASAFRTLTLFRGFTRKILLYA
jgi:hypothetical protein